MSYEKYLRHKVLQQRGERDPDIKCNIVKCHMQFIGNLDEEEKDPIVYLDTSLHFGNKKQQPLKIYVHPVKKTEQQFYLHFPKGEDLPADASIWFHLMAKQKSSEGLYLYESTGSSRLFIVDLLGNGEGAEHTFKDEKTGELKHQSFLCLPYMKYRKEEAEPKATVVVHIDRTYNPKHRSRISFRNPAPYDYTPGNNKSMEILTIMTVENDMCMFYAKESSFGEKVKPVLNTISKELAHVHAPYYGSSLMTLPGYVYFANVLRDDDPDEDVYQNMLDITLARHKIGREEFVQMCVLPSGDDMDDKKSKDLHLASCMVMQTCTLLANSIPYIGDYAYVSRTTGGDKLVSLEIKAGAVKTIPFSQAFVRHYKGREPDESFDDALRRQSGDCEDLAHLTMRCFRHIKQSKWQSESLLSAQRVSNLYSVAAVLGSVANGRNLKEGHTHRTGQTIVNSKEDKDASFGAHMWCAAFPNAHLGKMVDKSNGKAFSKGLIKLPEGQTISDVNKPWMRKLPTLIGEGTGLLYPLMLAPEAYVNTVESKKRETDITLKEKSTYARLETGMTIKEIEAKGGSAKKLTIFSKVDTIKKQKDLTNERNKRSSPFYRDPSAFFFTVSNEMEPKWNGLHSDDVSVPEELLNSDIHKAATRLSWRVVRPVQVGTREEDMGTEDEVPPDKIQHGIPLVDILNNREHIGLILSPIETPSMLKSIGSAGRHLPALKDIKKTKHSESKQNKTLEEKTNKWFNRFINDPKREQRSDFEEEYLMEGPLKEIYVMDVLDKKALTKEESTALEDSYIGLANCYKKTIEGDAEKVGKQFAKEIGKNKWVLGARAISEPVANGLGYMRYEVAVDVSGRPSLSNDVTFEKNMPV